MGGEVVHDHHVSAAERRAQDLAKIGLKNLRIGRAFDGHAGGRAIPANRANHGGGMPMAVRSLAVDTLAAGRAAAQPRQIGLGPGLIQEDQLGRVEAGLPPPPRPARPGDVRTILFAGPERLFLYVSPSFFNA